MTFDNQKQLTMTVFFNSTLYPLSYSYWMGCCLYLARVEYSVHNMTNELMAEIEQEVFDSFGHSFDHDHQYDNEVS